MSVAALIAGVCLLGGGGGSAWADPMPADRAAEVAAEATAQLASRLPPARSTILVDQEARCGRASVFAVEFERALRRAGFALAAPAQAHSAHPVTYTLREAWDGAYVLELNLSGARWSSAFTPDRNGRLQPAGPVARRAFQ